MVRQYGAQGPEHSGPKPADARLVLQADEHDADGVDRDDVRTAE